MPRIRSTKPSFFRHEELQQLEIEFPHAKVMLFFAGLWGLCDNKGRFEWRPRQIKLDILPFIPYDPEETLNILWCNNFIEKYIINEQIFGHVINLPKHQRFSGKEAKEGERFPAPNDNNIIACVKKEAAGKQQGSSGEEKTLHIDNQSNPMGSNGEATGKHLGTQEKEKEKEKEKENPRNDISVSNEVPIVGIEQQTKSLVSSKKRDKKISSAPKKTNPDVEPFQDLYITLFNNEWFQIGRGKFKWQPKDFSAIKKISKLLRSEKDIWDESTAKKEIGDFLKKAKRHSFIAKNNFENLNYPMLLSYFNPIISNNQNGQQESKPAAHSVGRTITLDRP